MQYRTACRSDSGRARNRRPCSGSGRCCLHGQPTTGRCCRWRRSSSRHSANAQRQRTNTPGDQTSTATRSRRRSAGPGGCFQCSRSCAPSGPRRRRNRRSRPDTSPSGGCICRGSYDLLRPLQPSTRCPADRSSWCRRGDRSCCSATRTGRRATSCSCSCWWIRP